MISCFLKRGIGDIKLFLLFLKLFDFIFNIIDFLINILISIFFCWASITTSSFVPCLTLLFLLQRKTLNLILFRLALNLIFYWISFLNMGLEIISIFFSLTCLYAHLISFFICLISFDIPLSLYFSFNYFRYFFGLFFFLYNT